MRTEIMSNGNLIIVPETELESYALKCWCAENTMPDGNLDTSKFLVYSEIIEDISNLK
jgi:hypothetical protein